MWRVSTCPIRIFTRAREKAGPEAIKSPGLGHGEIVMSPLHVRWTDNAAPVTQLGFKDCEHPIDTLLFVFAARRKGSPAGAPLVVKVASLSLDEVDAFPTRERISRLAHVARDLDHLAG